MIPWAMPFNTIKPTNKGEIMKPILFASLFILCVTLSGFAQAPYVAFITGDDEYRSEITMPMMAKILENHHGFQCGVAFAVNPETRQRNPKYKKNIEDLSILDQADLAVFFLRFRTLPDDQLQKILDYTESGKPMVGLRTTTHAFRYEDGEKTIYNDGFGKEIFGQKWITHHGHASRTNVYPIEAVRDHPILRGIVPFQAASWLYHVTPLQGDCTPLLMGKAVNSNKQHQFDEYPRTQPVAWTKTHTTESGKKARVFFTTLGHPADFEVHDMRELLINGIYWALGMEEKIPPDGSKAETVGDYTAPETH
jgi:type 1 glutamine amidotransferase